MEHAGRPRLTPTSFLPGANPRPSSPLVNETQPSCPTPSCRHLPVAVLAKLSHERCPEYAYAFWHCSGCGIGFVHPQPGATTLESLYSDYAYHGPPSARSIRRYRLKLKLTRWLRWTGSEVGHSAWATRAAEALAGRSLSASMAIPPSLPADAPILEVGFGNGSWLLAMRALGYTQLAGFDLQVNSEAIAALRDQGINVLSGPETWPAEAFACIRLEHVFEHLPEPQDLLGVIHEALRPDGLLVMTMPSIHAWEPVEQLAESQHLDYLQLPIHLFHHSQQSMRSFLGNAGFEVLEIRVLKPYRYLSVAARKRSRCEVTTP
jgi:SAM-dependent methyltransferase